MGNIRYCRQCGHALSEESRFCEYCGAKVEREAPVRTQRPQEPGVFSPREDGSTQRQSVRRQPGAAEQRRPRTQEEKIQANRRMNYGEQGSPRMQQDAGERRTRYQQERLQGSWEESWNRDFPEEDERRITPVQYLLLGLIAILIAALIALGLFWMKGRSGNRNAQDGGNVQVAQTETTKNTAGKDSGDGSVITILDGDGQAQSESAKQTSTAETPKEQNAVTGQTTEQQTEKVSERQTGKITEKQTEAVTIPTGQPQTSAQGGSYILPQSSERLLTDSDVDGMSYDEMQMAINEIYARHGRKFSSQSVQSYFDGQSWYQGTVEPDNFSDSVFSQIESQNVQFLLKKMGIE